MKAPLFLLVLSLYALNSSAGVFEHPVDNLSGRSLENPNITGNFLQKRFIPELKTEIISSGKFSINKERGVLWQNLTPFQSTTIISGALICSLTEQDSSVKSTPALKEFLDLINAL
ncbi:MAG: hypothetical protein LBP51_06645, partial [Deferribacteraceae bacterium]|nr:hypothetical protein [Deferribacteraceae bacterium]